MKLKTDGMKTEIKKINKNLIRNKTFFLFNMKIGKTLNASKSKSKHRASLL
jgi:hypothetical protein